MKLYELEPVSNNKKDIILVLRVMECTILITLANINRLD